MRNSVYFSTIAAMLLLLVSCNKTFVSLDATNAKDEVPQLGNLSFHFSKSLVADSLLNRWESARYISFEPAIPGRFRWEHPDELVFSPSRPLPPATTFKAIFHKEILKSSKYGRLENADNIVIQTPDLKLETNNISWVLQDENSNTAVPQIDLNFNYPINPATIKR